MAIFTSRCFAYAKDPENPQQNQDAFQINENTNVAVIADGVSSAIFSAAWADILVRKIAENPPTPGSDSFKPWLDARRVDWSRAIDTTNLAWFQKPKLATGAFSTLLWVKVEPCAPPRNGSSDWVSAQPIVEGRPFYLVTGHVIGDSCLFLVKPNRTDSPIFPGTDLFRVFPLMKSEDFEASPIVLGSTDLGKDSMLDFKPIRFIIQEGDWILLATDAVSQWILRTYEAGVTPYWDQFWTLTPEQWGEELDSMRSVGEIRYDDSTLMILRVGAEVSEMVQTPEVVSATEFESEPELVSEPEPELEPEPEPEPEPEIAASYDDSYGENFAERFEEDFAEEPAEELAINSCPEFESPQEVPEPRPELEPVQPFMSVAPPISQPQPTQPVRPAQPMQPTQSVQPTQPVQPVRSNPNPFAKPQQPAESSPSEGASGNAHRNEWIERTSAVGNRLSSAFQSFTKRSGEIASVVGDHIADGMDRLGGQTQEAYEAAKPQFQRAMENVKGVFHSKDGEKADDSADESGRNAPSPVRQIDPNRRRFYHPKDEK